MVFDSSSRIEDWVKWNGMDRWVLLGVDNNVDSEEIFDGSFGYIFPAR